MAGIRPGQDIPESIYIIIVHYIFVKPLATESRLLPDAAEVKHILPVNAAEVKHVLPVNAAEVQTAPSCGMIFMFETLFCLAVFLICSFC